MKSRTSLINILLAMSLCFLLVGTATASCEQNRVKKYWHKHSEAKKVLMKTWIQNQSASQYAEAIYTIGKYEIYLAKNCVRYAHEAFVNRLAGDVKSEYDYPVFAYSVFQYELKRLVGYQVKPAALFQKKTFSIYKK